MIDPINPKPFKLQDDTIQVTKPKNQEHDRTAPPFMDVLRDSVMRVNDVQVQSDQYTQRLALGEVEDISEVSIAVEKAELALRLMVQIRDKLVDAYQQIARMSV